MPSRLGNANPSPIITARLARPSFRLPSLRMYQGPRVVGQHRQTGQPNRSLMRQRLSRAPVRRSAQPPLRFVWPCCPFFFCLRRIFLRSTLRGHTLDGTGGGDALLDDGPSEGESRFANLLSGKSSPATSPATPLVSSTSRQRHLRWRSPRTRPRASRLLVAAMQFSM